RSRDSLRSARCGCSTLTATSRLSTRSRPRYTTAMPPCPTSSIMSYLSIRVPARLATDAFLPRPKALDAPGVELERPPRELGRAYACPTDGRRPCRRIEAEYAWGRAWAGQPVGAHGSGEVYRRGVGRAPWAPACIAVRSRLVRDPCKGSPIA